MDRTGVTRVSRRLVVELIVVVLASFHAGLPKGDSYAQAWRATAHHPLLILHILVGTVIVAEAVVLLIRCLRHRQPGWSAVALIGFVFVLLAFVAGDRYLALQRAGAIDLMGIAWFAALVTYALAWYLGHRIQVRGVARSG